MTRTDIQLPVEGSVVVVEHEYGADAGRVEGIEPGHRSGSFRDRQDKLIVKNGTVVAKIPLETIKEVRSL